MTDSLRVLMCQVHIPETSTEMARDQHLRALRERVEQALSVQPADLVLLPELCSVDYSRAAFSQLNTLAEPLDGLSRSLWAGVSQAHGCHVAYSIPRIDNTGQFRITHVVVGPDGHLVGHYDKIHLAQFGASMEKEYFVAGDAVFSFSVNGFVLAPIICADIRFPELSRTLTVDHNVDVILHPSAYSRDPTFHSWHSFVQTRALENQVYVISLNRAGDNYGASIAVPPWVDETRSLLALPKHAEHFQRVLIERDAIAYARSTYAFLQDRRDRY